MTHEELLAKVEELEKELAKYRRKLEYERSDGSWICLKCKYLESDYYWDEEVGDEVKTRYCTNGKDIETVGDSCELFEEYKPKPHKETRTVCDTCKSLSDCKESGKVVDCTGFMDNFRHFTPSFGTVCETYRKGGS